MNEQETQPENLLQPQQPAMPIASVPQQAYPQTPQSTVQPQNSMAPQTFQPTITTEMTQNIASVPQQDTQSTQVNQSQPAAAAQPSYQAPSMPLAVPPALPTPPIPSDNALTKLHGHERPMAIVTIASVFVISTAMVFGGLHIAQARANNKAKYLAAQRDASPTYQHEKAIEGFGQEIQDRPNGTLDLSRTIEPYKTINTQDIIDIKIGQQINFLNGTSLLIRNIDKNWTAYGKSDAPKEGSKYLKLSVLVGNRSTASQSFYPKLSAHDGSTSVDVRIRTLINKTVLGEEANTETFSLQVKPQTSATDVVVVEIPQDFNPQTISIAFTGYGSAREADSSGLKEYTMKATIKL